MRAGLLVTGVLGAGTALVFAAAALTATLFPNGTVVTTQWNGGWGGPCFDCGGWEVPAPMPMPMPGGGFVEGDVFVEGVQVSVSGDMVVADEAVPAP
jgi:hypothetical protein